MNKLVDSTKDFVDFSVSVSPLPPSFNDARVVSMDDDVPANARQRGESVYEEFESHCLRPSDVSLTIVCFPPWD